MDIINSYKFNDLSRKDIKEFVTPENYSNLKNDNFLGSYLKITRNYNGKGISSSLCITIDEYFYAICYKKIPDFKLSNFQSEVFNDLQSTKDCIRDFFNNGENNYENFIEKLAEKKICLNKGFSDEDSTFSNNLKNIFNMDSLEYYSRLLNIDIVYLANMSLSLLSAHGNKSTKSNSVNGNAIRKYLGYKFVNIQGLTSGKILFEMKNNYSTVLTIKEDLAPADIIQALLVIIILKENKNTVVKYENLLKSPDIDEIIFENRESFDEYCKQNSLNINDYNLIGGKGSTNKIFFNKKTKIAKRKDSNLESLYSKGIDHKIDTIKEKLNKIIGDIAKNNNNIQYSTSKKITQKKDKSIYSSEWHNKTIEYYGLKNHKHIESKMLDFAVLFDCEHYPTLVEKLFAVLFDYQTYISYSEQHVFKQMVQSRVDYLLTINGNSIACDPKAFRELTERKNAYDLMKMMGYLHGCEKLNNYQDGKTWGFFALMDNKWEFDYNNPFETSCENKLKFYNFHFNFLELIDAAHQCLFKNQHKDIKVLSDKVFQYFKDVNLI